VGHALNVHRLHFAFTITFHYIFPQLTMRLALLLVYLKTKALCTGDERYNRAARFWGRIFGINFAVGVITAIPMEFQFGTNWAAFSKSGRRRDWPNAGNGRRVFLFSGVEQLMQADAFGSASTYERRLERKEPNMMLLRAFSFLPVAAATHSNQGRNESAQSVVSQLGHSVRRQ